MRHVITASLSFIGALSIVVACGNTPPVEIGADDSDGSANGGDGSTLLGNGEGGAGKDGASGEGGGGEAEPAAPHAAAARSA
jgi:hypothetical protein